MFQSTTLQGQAGLSQELQCFLSVGRYHPTVLSFFVYEMIL